MEQPGSPPARRLHAHASPSFPSPKEPVNERNARARAPHRRWSGCLLRQHDVACGRPWQSCQIRQWPSRTDSCITACGAATPNLPPFVVPLVALRKMGEQCHAIKGAQASNGGARDGHAAGEAPLDCQREWCCYRFIPWAGLVSVVVWLDGPAASFFVGQECQSSLSARARARWRYPLYQVSLSGAFCTWVAHGRPLALCLSWFVSSRVVGRRFVRRRDRALSFVPPLLVPAFSLCLAVGLSSATCCSILSWEEERVDGEVAASRCARCAERLVRSGFVETDCAARIM
ncbi:hypothetical protein BKA80DRAFT_108857 [Phyllosticta citrichinensis]